MTEAHTILESGKFYRFNPPDNRSSKEPIFPDLECQQVEQKAYINEGDVILVVNQTIVEGNRSQPRSTYYCSTKIILGDRIGHIWEYVDSLQLGKNFAESFKEVSPEEVFE